MRSTTMRDRCPFPLISLAFAAAILFSGCRSVWVHPDWSQKKFENDLGECSKAPAWKLCMKSRGWHTEFGWRWDPETRPAKGEGASG